MSQPSAALLLLGHNSQGGSHDAADSPTTHEMLKAIICSTQDLPLLALHPPHPSHSMPPLVNKNSRLSHTHSSGGFGGSLAVSTPPLEHEHVLRDSTRRGSQPSLTHTTHASSIGHLLSKLVPHVSSRRESSASKGRSSRVESDECSTHDRTVGLGLCNRAGPTTPSPPGATTAHCTVAPVRPPPWAQAASPFAAASAAVAAQDPQVLPQKLQGGTGTLGWRCSTSACSMDAAAQGQEGALQTLSVTFPAQMQQQTGASPSSDISIPLPVFNSRSCQPDISSSLFIENTSGGQLAAPHSAAGRPCTEQVVSADGCATLSAQLCPREAVSVNSASSLNKGASSHTRASTNNTVTTLVSDTVIHQMFGHDEGEEDQGILSTSAIDRHWQASPVSGLESSAGGQVTPLQLSLIGGRAYQQQRTEVSEADNEPRTSKSGDFSEQANPAAPTQPTVAATNRKQGGGRRHRNPTAGSDTFQRLMAKLSGSEAGATSAHRLHHPQASLAGRGDETGSQSARVPLSDTAIHICRSRFHSRADSTCSVSQAQCPQCPHNSVVAPQLLSSCPSHITMRGTSSGVLVPTNGSMVQVARRSALVSAQAAQAYVPPPAPPLMDEVEGLLARAAE